MTRITFGLVFIVGACSTTLSFEVDGGLEEQGVATDLAVDADDSNVDVGSTDDAASNDAAPNDAAVSDSATLEMAVEAGDGDIEAGANPNVAACQSACLDQVTRCSGLDGALCQSLCTEATDGRLLSFIECADDFFRRNGCIAPGETSCFAGLTSGGAQERACRQACLNDYIFCADPTACEQACGGRLPDDNDAFTSCARFDPECKANCLRL